MEWLLFIVLLFTALITNESEHLFIHLFTTWDSYLVNFLTSSLPTFLLCRFLNDIIYSKYLPVVLYVNIFFFQRLYFLALWCLSLVEKFYILMY